MTPAEELAAAADKLDALTEGARSGPWGTERKEDSERGGLRWHVCHIRDYPWLEVAYDLHEPNARYIAAMNPLVGKALASNLRAYQEAVERHWRVFHEMWKTEQRIRMMNDQMPGLVQALDLARLINGSGS